MSFHSCFPFYAVVVVVVVTVMFRSNSNFNCFIFNLHLFDGNHLAILVFLAKKS